MVLPWRPVPLSLSTASWASRRTASSESAAGIPQHTASGAQYGLDLLAGARKRKRDDINRKRLVLDVLNSTVTKRDVKSYLSKFTSEKSHNIRGKPHAIRKHDVGVNLGNLYIPARAIDQSPVFLQGLDKTTFADKTSEPLHVALVKIRDPHNIPDSTLQQIALTLVQLNRLGMTSVVVVDCNNYEDGRLLPAQQAVRLTAAIENHDEHGARCLDNILESLGTDERDPDRAQAQSGLRIANRKTLLSLLRKGKIPVVAPIAFTLSNQTLVALPANEAILALTRELAGLKPQLDPDAEPQAIAEAVRSMQKEVSLDRIIILDSLGGIPASSNADRSHVFVNLEQEYDAIKSELAVDLLSDSTRGSDDNAPSRKPAPEVHMSNLSLLRNTLALLPPSSSGLLTSPNIAARSNHPRELSPVLEVGTRTQRNPLIHNLLTDKPIFSPSLPFHRTQKLTINEGQRVTTTMFKHGMPVTMIPDPRAHPWRPPLSSNPSIQFSDPRIDFARLFHLIEDSFGRKLNVPHYLARVKNRIAGIIVAGDYEGCAILTWESPSHDPLKMVPYLDKLAVLKRSQGAGGVADVIFTAMVRTCLPQGLCWRSRQTNPVNKWYFERARGFWKLPGSNWTMFWTGEEAEDGGLFRDYESVCRKVEPSWE